MNPELLCMGCMEERGGAGVCPHCGWQETTVPESPHYLSPRTILQEQYMIGRALGHGGFAVTYLGWDLNLARKLALKEYFPSGIATRAAGTSTLMPFTGPAKDDFGYGLEKFLEEARVLARFQNHPGIIAVLNFFRANGTAYLVMEYLEGTTLKDYLAANTDKISYDTAVKLMMPVMDALREVHKAGILHRDISPDNIYITRSGQVKVLDFGAARFALSDRSQNLSVILKTGYAPEEQYRSKGKQGPWTDVYAVGATIYRAITGKIPPPATDRLEEDEIERPTVAGAVIDSESEKSLMKALAVRATERYQSMEDFQAALAAVSANGATRIIKQPEPLPAQQDPPVKPAPALQHKMSPKWLWASAAAVILLLVTGVVAKFSKPAVTEPEKTESIKKEQTLPSPQPAPSPVAQPNWVGRWQAVINDGSRQWTCVTENYSNGEYRFLSGCPQPFANERGIFESAGNGTWKLRANSGRTDQGTYRVISADQVEMTGTLGTAIWTRAMGAPGEPAQASLPRTPPRNEERQQPAAVKPRPPLTRDRPHHDPVKEGWQRQQAEWEQQRRQQDLEERQRQAQIAQQRRQQELQERQAQQQREFQEREAQRQRDQVIREGANLIQKLFR